MNFQNIASYPFMRKGFNKPTITNFPSALSEKGKTTRRNLLYIPQDDVDILVVGFS